MIKDRSSVPIPTEMLFDHTKYQPPKNGQSHSNDSSALADELLERVWAFCGVGA